MENKNFERPALKEAICEIRFNQLSDEDTQKIPGRLVAMLSENYPLFNVVDESPFKFSFGGNVIGQIVHRYAFSSQDHNYLITIKPDSFGFVFKPDEGRNYDWDAYYKGACLEWERVSQILSISEATRVGMRYVNLLSLDPDSKNSDYFANSDYIPHSPLEGNSNFLNRNEYSLDENNKFIITSGAQFLPEVNKKELVLDIDRITENKVLQKAEIAQHLILLHNDIEKVFFDSITDKYKQHMKPIGQ